MKTNPTKLISPARQAPLVLLCTLATLAFATAPALANSAHASNEHPLGLGPGEKAGQLELQAASATGEPDAGSSVAVNDETHDVYVADTGNHRVDEFEAGGAFVRAWGWGVVNGKAELQVCEGTCKAGISGKEPGELEDPVFVVVNNDLLSPSYGDVYVGDQGNNLVTKFTSEGALVPTWGNNGEHETPNGQLATLRYLPGSLSFGGIAVDLAGNLWVRIEAYMFEFAQSGAPPIEECNTNVGGHPGQVGVNGSNDLYFLGAEPTGPLEEFSSGCTRVGGFEPTEAVSGLAVDSSTNGLYLDLRTSIESVAPSGEVAEAFGSEQLTGGAGAGLAVNSSTGDLPFSGTVYAANTVSDQVNAFGVALEVNPKPGAASEVRANTATLNGEVNPVGSPVSECYFEYATSAVFAAEHVYDHTAPCEPDAAGLGEGTKALPVEAKLPGLLGGTEYHFRLVGKKGTTTVAGNDEVFTTATVPVVTGAEAKNLTLHPANPPEEPEATVSAELRASVNPEGLQVTRCVFEYGTTREYGASARCAQKKSAIGYGTEPVLVSTQLVGLAPDTKYYWRLSVRDEPVKGESREAFEPGHTFVYGTEGSALPDGRAYEMVTPPFKDGAALDIDRVGLVPSVAEEGLRVDVPSVQCPPGALSCTASNAKTTAGGVFEFMRTPAAGDKPAEWKTTALSPPATQYPANQAWVADASSGLALYSASTPSSGREQEFYVRGVNGSFTAFGPLAFPGSDQSTFNFSSPEHTVETSADFSHVVWEAPSHEGFWPFDQTTAERSVYEYPRTGSNEPPLLVGVSGGPGSHELIGVCGTGLGEGEEEDQRDAVSADGRTVYFTPYLAAGLACPSSSGSGPVNEHIPVPVRELYARVDGEAADAHTVAVSQPDALETAAETSPDEKCTGPCKQNIEAYVPPAVNPNWRDADFVDASQDGSKVVFEDTQQLTNEATEGAGNATGSYCEAGGDCNLYMYDFDEPAGHNLIDASEGVGGAPVPGGPRVQEVLTVSPDGSHVYFVALGKLADNRGALGAEAVAGEGNLYLYERDARYPTGHTAFIASLPSTDYNQGSAVDKGPNVTPEGRFLVFKSHGVLTPGDTRTDGSEQVFRYDAETEQLTRVSIGAEGFDDDGNAGAGNAYLSIRGPHRRADPTMANDGSRIFFESPIGLTPKALDDVPIGTNAAGTQYAENVYEWEQEGVGSCLAGHAAGCVYLISDGRDTAEAGGAESAIKLIGSDATGDNVFFTTADQLVPADTDTEVNVYDARVCEPAAGNPCIAESTPPLPPCLGEQCHGIPAATPSLLAPGTASFNGEGNIAPAPAKPAVKKTLKCKKPREAQSRQVCTAQG